MPHEVKEAAEDVQKFRHVLREYSPRGETTRGVGGAPGELAIANQNFNCGSAVSVSVAHLKNRLAQRNFAFIFPTSFYLFNWVFFAALFINKIRRPQREFNVFLGGPEYNKRASALIMFELSND